MRAIFRRLSTDYVSYKSTVEPTLLKRVAATPPDTIRHFEKEENLQAREDVYARGSPAITATTPENARHELDDGGLLVVAAMLSHTLRDPRVCGAPAAGN